MSTIDIHPMTDPDDRDRKVVIEDRKCGGRAVNEEVAGSNPALAAN